MNPFSVRHAVQRVLDGCFGEAGGVNADQDDVFLAKRGTAGVYASCDFTIEFVFEEAAVRTAFAGSVGPPEGGRVGKAAGSEATEAVRKAEASLWTQTRSG